MIKATREIERAELRVAVCAESVKAQVHALKLRVHQSATKPYVIASLGIAAVVCGYLVVRQYGKQITRPSHSNAFNRLTNVLKSVHMLSELYSSIMLAPLRKSLELPIVNQNISVQKQLSDAPQVTWSSQQLKIFKASFQAWMDDNASSMGAALSYYTLFSLAPLLVIVFAAAGMLFGEQAAHGEIVAQLRGTIGIQGSLAVEELLKTTRDPTQDVIATLIGVAVWLLGATAVFAELQSALDRIWRVVVPPEETGVWHLLRTRLLSFVLLIGLSLMLAISFVVSAALPIIAKWANERIEGSGLFLEIIAFVASLGIFTLLFAMVYKLMPRGTIVWRDVWTGAAVTALLFSVGKLLIDLYLYKSSLASGYGAVDSFVVIFAWVYYSAQIFLFGAEYTWVYANQHGSRGKHCTHMAMQKTAKP